MSHQQSITSYYAVRPPLGKIPLGNIPVRPIHSPLQSAVSIVSSTTPIAMANKVKGNASAIQGLGQFANGGGFVGGMSVALAAGILVAFGALSYQTGKAMAPNNAKAKSWGWIGVPVGMFTGPIGLGIMGIVSNSQQNR